MSHLLTRLEAYYDDVPRVRADVEECGPFTLFLARTGWPYYARPRLGLTDQVTADDVRAVFTRQDELHVPRAIEWVEETTPGLAAAVERAGGRVGRYPLLVLDGAPVARTAPVTTRLMTPDDPDLALVDAAISVGFAHGGTATGPASYAERDARVAAAGARSAVASSLADGSLVQFGAFDASGGAVGGGSHCPRGPVTEIVGVGVLPSHRRQGIAGHLTWVLAQDALRRGADTVFMSAGGDDVARVYEGVGFRRVATACIATADVAAPPGPG